MRLYKGLRTGSIEIWNQTGSVGNYWNFAQVNVSTTAGFELIFDAEIGMNFRRLCYFFFALRVLSLSCFGIFSISTGQGI